jgi:sortase A
MPLRVYTKEYYSAKKRAAHIFSYISLTIGTMMLFWSAWPFVSFSIFSKLFLQQNLMSPIPQSQTIAALAEARSVMGTYDVSSSNLRDFVQANLWFPSKPQIAPPSRIVVKEFSISIPKLNIVNAKVAVGGEDLSKSLIQFLPTSLPGENGNVNIFGHSNLPYYYNPKDYTTIFTYLPSLEKGDKVYIKMADKNYTYEVFDLFIVQPDEVSVLDQKYDDSYISLFTCVPPGTTTARAVIRARLVRDSS